MIWRKKSSKSIIQLGINLLIPFFCFGQQHNVPLNQSFSFQSEREILRSETIIHSSFKPILQQEVEGIDTAAIPSLLSPRNLERSFVARKLFVEHFITLDTGKIHLTIDPLFNFELGEEMEEDSRDISLFKNTRGFNIKLSLGDKVAVESSFRENQANLPFYLSQQTNLNQVAYGQGRVKTFKEDGYDFAMASAYISYSPSKRVNIQAGHGKHFVGNGHRSLLLSDLAFNYPFLKVNSNWFNNKLQYQNLYTIFQDLTRLESVDNSEGLFERKQGAFHFLEYAPNSKFSIGLFEGVIFPSLDTSGNLNVGANFWAPVIFLNTLLEGSENQGNSIIGTNMSLRIAQKIELYNQVVIADEEFDDVGLQFGAKWYLHRNLMIQGEYNFTGGVSSNSLYSHYNESLNHPVQFLDAHELIGIAQFQKKRWMTRAVVNYIDEGMIDVQAADFRQLFIVNPSFNFSIHLGVQMRNLSYEDESALVNTPQFLPEAARNSTYVYFGLSTNLQNLYFNY